MARPSIYDAPQALREVTIARAGYLPTSAVLAEREVSHEAIARLADSLRALPTPVLGPDRGAVDIKLERPDGSQVKDGTVILEGIGGNRAIAIDPTTRRFRCDDLAPGEYRIRAASAMSGRGSRTLQVRPGDVSRALLRLDGKRLQGTTTARFELSGTRAKKIRARAYDKDTGALVVDRWLDRKSDIVQIEVPYGRLHWRWETGDERSCYDTDDNADDDFRELFDPHRIELIPIPDPIPDPEDPRFGGLGPRFGRIVRFLPKLGVDSIETLAALEPEDLMHRARNLRATDSTPVHSRMFGEVIAAARRASAVVVAAGDSIETLSLGAGASFARAFKPAASGEVALDVDLAPGEQAELRIDGLGPQKRYRVKGSQSVKFTLSQEDVASGKALHVSIANASARAVNGLMRVRLPLDRATRTFVPVVPTVEQMIESVLRAVAAQNPGIGTDLPPAITEPENIRMWIDRAKTFMAKAGVCSMNDLGRFRLDPIRKLRTGVYLAPVVQPPKPGSIAALKHYAFAELLQDRVLYYAPNDLLHSTAVVLAGEWDIRGQNVIIASDVRELVVIVGSIRHDAASRISWEQPGLPPANAYWPNPAPSGANGQGPGAHGVDGADGDQDPHSSKNGGAPATTPAPIVSMWILDAGNGLPRIDLPGQKGGTGGRGQDGGRGGDGDCGLRADGTFFGGCCRGVGFGGNGGQGGDGGRGGKGGRGGDGGRMTVLTTAESIAALSIFPPMVDLNPGPGGDGGPPGNPGGGGLGGPAGTADCETWCDEHPERRGSDGATGNPGSIGFAGDPGPAVLPDAFQLLPITAAQWQQEFNQPHILDIEPSDAEPGATVTISGQNFDPTIDRVFFDGVNVGPVSSATQASFVVPGNTDGGYHPIVIRPAGATDRRSNRAMLRVLPVLDDLPGQPRWVEGQAVVLAGRAFMPGVQVFAEDRSVSPPLSYPLPVQSSTATSIALQIPAAPLGAMRGVRRIVVRNPDNGASRAERAIRIGDTIVVKVAAFRVVGTSPGIGTTRSAAQIAALFSETGFLSVSSVWQQARIVFRLVQPVSTITVSDDLANLWPLQNNATDTATYNAAPFVPGALNLFFVRDVSIATAYCYFGGGPSFIGDEAELLGDTDWKQVVAHEIGHGLCLRHVCDGSGEGAGTFFNTVCDEDDHANFLMYPFWDVSDGMDIHSGQVDTARSGATHFEDGKVNTLPAGSLFQGLNNCPQCQAADTQN
ncbi:MAG: IPT/TIG domain-containing protein [Pseudomonadota bacterium]